MAAGASAMAIDLALVLLAAVVLGDVAAGASAATGHLFSPAVPLTIASLLFLAVLWNRLGHMVQAYRRAGDLSSLPYGPDERYRVQVHCWADEVEELGRVTPDAFEPEQFRAVIPDRRLIDLTKPVNWTWPWVVIWVLVHFAFSSRSVLVASAVGVLMAFGALWLFRLPTYLRFTPGRVEILQYPVFRSASPRKQAFGLRGRVSVSAKGAGKLDWLDEQGKPRVLRMFMVFDRRHALRAALAAALSDAEVPEPE